MRLRAGPYPNPMLIADTNPDAPDHWLKRRCDNGMTQLLNTYHKDNPSYWNKDKQAWTKRGTNYVQGKLQRLSGVRRARVLENKWAIAEGAIYEFSEELHVLESIEDCPPFVRRYRSIDFGFRNPLVVQWWGEDADKRLYLYREIYMTGLLVSDAAIEVVRLEAGLSQEDVQKLRDEFRDVDDPDGRFWRQMWALAKDREPIYASVADHDREDRATLEKYGIVTVAARKSVANGIQAVQQRLRVDETGKPALFIVRNARVRMDPELKEAGKPTSTLEEMPGYVWNDAKKQEEPVKEDDHGVDAVRYMVMYFDDPEAESDKVEMRRASMPSGRQKLSRGRTRRRF